MERRTFLGGLIGGAVLGGKSRILQMPVWWRRARDLDSGGVASLRGYSRTRYTPGNLPDVYSGSRLHDELQQVAQGIPWAPFTVDVRDFGARGDGSGDDTAAIQAAIGAAENAYNATVLFPNGVFRVTGPIVIRRGVMLTGPGSQGSNEGYGCVIKQYSTDGLFTWNGTGGYTAGTGGGMRNMLLVKAAGFLGGDAIYLYGTDDNHRPGEMMFENILVSGESGPIDGGWARGLHIDGTNCKTSESKGVRSVVLHKFRVARCTTSDEYILVNQGVHVSGTHVEIDPAGGSGRPGITVMGDSDNFMLSNAILNGTLIIRGTSAMNVCVHGRVSRLTVDNSLVQGAATVESEGIDSAARDFRIVSNRADAFRSVLTRPVDNVTGDGTPWTLIPDLKEYDKNRGVDVGRGRFVARVAGVHDIRYGVTLTGLTPSHTQAEISIIQANQAGNTIRRVPQVTDLVINPTGAGQSTVGGSASLELDHGDAVSVSIKVFGGARVVGVEGASGVQYTWLAGHVVA